MKRILATLTRRILDFIADGSTAEICDDVDSFKREDAEARLRIAALAHEEAEMNLRLALEALPKNTQNGRVVPLIDCPDCGRGEAMNGRCPKCGGASIKTTAYTPLAARVQYRRKVSKWQSEVDDRKRARRQA